ncbi:DUF3247 family protein [Tahibacter amnicola]|uniref:DUF3247 family protein n=1 Tax=Tahibacter amnicola TaxID=2976241 RepID=A0ABY6BKF3_9GAMM|nr:DUF3247 family protein [Tahibacter amnicola]UXI69883.1 DUF3247 family protein [Tahibacter amnicola]
MAKYCDHVYSSPQDVAWLEGLIQQLPGGEHVRVTCRDGRIVTGIVSEPPILQVAEQPDGREGSNALLRLERAGGATLDGICDIWLDTITRVEPLIHPQVSELSH